MIEDAPAAMAVMAAAASETSAEAASETVPGLVVIVGVAAPVFAMGASAPVTMHEMMEHR
jgi:hypothetical protein